MAFKFMLIFFLLSLPIIITIFSSQATAWFLYEHVNFFYDLVVDWGSPHYIPDIFEFVPYTWHINVRFEEFELLLQANEFNWIDTASSNPENSKCESQVCSICMTHAKVRNSSELCVKFCSQRQF